MIPDPQDGRKNKITMTPIFFLCLATSVLCAQLPSGLTADDCPNYPFCIIRVQASAGTRSAVLPQEPLRTKEEEDSYQLVDSVAGKVGVKILFASKQGAVHNVRELEIETSLTLNNQDAFTAGDNRDVIATDSQRNTVYILARTYGITSPEEFGLILTNHFLSQYPWVVKARITISEHAWQRIIDSEGRPHNHAFVSNSMTVHVASVTQSRGGDPVVAAGIRNLRILKTTQSGFENFFDDAYTTLTDTSDRLLSTTLTADWTYSDVVSDYDSTYTKVLTTILDSIAGPVDTGVYSPSVQYTQNQAQQAVLEKVPQIASITMSMPNVHYIEFDMSRFPLVPELATKKGEVFQPLDKPSGNIRSTLVREEQND